MGRKPGNVLPRTARPVPESIMRPDYANSGTPRAVDLRPSWMIEVKSQKDVEMMRAAGRCAREVLDATGRAVKPGVTTDYLDEVAHAATIERGAYPSPLNYHGFPKSICTSVNEVICHGIPDDIPLKEGDVVNVDITVYLNGYHGDCSEMFYVGQVDDKSKKLVEATYDCWQAAIEACRPGVNYKQLKGSSRSRSKVRGINRSSSSAGTALASCSIRTPTCCTTKTASRTASWPSATPSRSSR